MVPESLKSKIKEDIGLNPEIMTGLTNNLLNLTVKYISDILESRCPKFMKFEGCRILTPEESMKFMMKLKGWKSLDANSKLDVNQTYQVLYAFNFSYNGVPLRPKYFYLPFTKDGIFLLKDSPYYFKSILSERSFRYNDNKIFIELTSGKLNFFKLSHPIYLEKPDGKKEVYDVFMAYGWLHNKSKKKLADQKRANRPSPLAVHYLFAKYGVMESFQKFYKEDFEMEVGFGDKINYNNFDPNLYCIFSATDKKGISLDHKDKIDCEAKVAIKKEHLDSKILVLLNGLFYIWECFTSSFTVEYDLLNQDIFIYLLGRVIKPSADISRQIIVKDAIAHLETMDGYFDLVVKKDLQSNGVIANDIYDLLWFVIRAMENPEFLLKEDHFSLENTMFKTHRYIVKELINGFNTAFFLLNNLYSYKSKEVGDQSGITASNIERVLNSKSLFPQVVINNISRTNHKEVVYFNYPGDNFFIGAFSNLVLQDKYAKGSKKNSSIALSDPANHVNASHPWVTGYNDVTKSSPESPSKINPCLKLNSRYCVQLSREDKLKINELRERISK